MSTKFKKALATVAGWLRRHLRAKDDFGADPLDELLKSARTGDIDGVRKSIAEPIPTHDKSLALISAATNGHVECVRLLIPVSDPKTMESWALRQAARKGHVECVRLLAPFSDCGAGDSDALLWAMTNKNIECARIVIPFSDADGVRKQIPREDRSMYDSLVQETLLRKKHDIVRQDRNATGL